MTKVRLLSLTVAVICCQNWAAAQSGRSFITGFELGSLAEGGAMGGSVQSSIVRSGRRNIWPVSPHLLRKILIRFALIIAHSCYEFVFATYWVLEIAANCSTNIPR